MCGIVESGVAVGLGHRRLSIIYLERMTDVLTRTAREAR
jgi:hypothetical protein